MAPLTTKNCVSADAFGSRNKGIGCCPEYDRYQRVSFSLELQFSRLSLFLFVYKTPVSVFAAQIVPEWPFLTPHSLDYSGLL